MSESWGRFTSDVRERRLAPRFCRRCGEALPLTVTDVTPCPHCAQTFDPRDPETFAARRAFSAWRFWLPGFCLAVASGVVSYGACLHLGEMGYALFFAVPLSMGSILGYGVQARVWLVVLLGIVLVCAVGLAIVSMHWAGIFCGGCLGAIFVVPTFIGIGLGALLRVVMSQTAWNQRWFFPTPFLFFVALPTAAQLVERHFPVGREVAVVRTRLTLDATPQEAWNALVFYEEVRHEPPWLLRLALPKPFGAEGDKRRPGEVVRCFYDRGRLSKRVREVVPQRRVAFDVIEQHLHFERDVALQDGAFELTPLPGGQTRLEVTTRYQRLLRPAWLWRPMEEEIIQTLHEHVLEGVRRNVIERREHPKGESDPPTVAPPRLTGVSR